jgi:thiol-disulfide isomerase/thioredoxin
MKNIFLGLLLMVSFSDATAQIQIGDSLPNSSLANVKNETVDLSSFKGKTILVDFWASWCAPCRLANRKLVQLHSELAGHKFEIIGVSLDTDITKWINAIKKDKIEYIQLNEPKGFDAKVAVRFGVEQLPTTYMFDSEGRLLAFNPTEEEIIAQIKKQL